MLSAAGDPPTHTEGEEMSTGHKLKPQVWSWLSMGNRGSQALGSLRSDLCQEGPANLLLKTGFPHKATLQSGIYGME